MKQSLPDTGARRWWALGALALALVAIGLDATVLNLALPTLAADLRASTDELQWFVAAYMLVLAAGMLPAGLLGDRFGRKRLLLGALVVFGLGSIACAYSPSPAALVAARTALGLGGAFLVTLSLSVITILFAPAERPRAIGIWAAANFLALPVGPILGGWLLTSFWWGWVFLINVPVILVALVAVLALVPESRSAERRDLDPLGMLGSSAGLAALTYGFIKAGQSGWGETDAVLPLCGGIALLIAFGLWERRIARRGGQPLVDLELFRSRSFTWGTILAGVGILAMFGGLFTLPQYFQGVVGLDPQATGLRLLPMIAGIVLGGGTADRLASRIGAKATTALGFLVLATAMLAGATTALGASDLFTATWIVGAGVGMGLSLATAASAALVELSAERSGIGSGLMQTVQKMGGPLGVAILGSVLNGSYRAAIDVSALPPSAAAAAQKSVFAGLAVAQQLRSPALAESVRAAFVSSMDAVLVVSAVAALAGTVLAFAFLPNVRGTQAKGEPSQSGHERTA